MPYKNSTNNTVMWFDKPAENWLQSLPAGNGHIGCMINNDPYRNIISLNDDTLWSGYPRDYCKPDFKTNMDKVRELMVKGKRAQAEEIIEAQMANRFTQAYLPFGDIIVQSQAGAVDNYRRELNMQSAIIDALYDKDGCPVHTQTFVSYPDDVLVHKIAAQSAIDCDISFVSQIKYDVCYDENGFTVNGCAPSDLTIVDVGNFYNPGNKVSYHETDKSINIAACAQIKTDGQLAVYADKLSVTGAKSISMIYSSATSFQVGDAYESHCLNTVLHAAKKGIDKIREDHISDHSLLFNRMQIDLGGEDASCDERIARMRRNEICNSDISLLFQYGRYLLIASSRKGTQAANLQGIWNKDLIPPWWSGYTLNINLQMNYWLADRTNLSGCFDPFTAYTKRLCEAGKKTAKDDYGTGGAVAHHQSDIWAHSTPVGHDVSRIPASARYMMWNLPLAWLCIQMFDHYQYTLDERYLETELLPIMRSTAEFIMAHFTEVDGRYYNIPTTSPENMYTDENGQPMAVCNMSALDIGLTKDFFQAYIFACKRFGDMAEASRCALFADRIAGYAVSENGELLEWDREYEETEPGHRHFSMLYGVYPGSHLLGSPHADAAKKLLMKRLQSGSGQTGWSAVWAIALLARFGESEAAYDIIKKLMSENIHDNLFGAHPPDLFQIDANFGFTAAICELIIQEYNGIIKLLPALPKAMAHGRISGLKIFKGHEVSLEWEASRVVFMQISAAVDDEIVVDARHLVSESARCETCSEGIRIFLEKGGIYRFSQKTD